MTKHHDELIAELQVLSLQVNNFMLQRELALLQSEHSKLPATEATAKEMLELLRAIATDMAAMRQQFARSFDSGNALMTQLTDQAQAVRAAEEAASSTLRASQFERPS